MLRRLLGIWVARAQAGLPPLALLDGSAPPRVELAPASGLSLMGLSPQPGLERLLQAAGVPGGCQQLGGAGAELQLHQGLH